MKNFLVIKFFLGVFILFLVCGCDNPTHGINKKEKSLNQIKEPDKVGQRHQLYKRGKSHT